LTAEDFFAWGHDFFLVLEAVEVIGLCRQVGGAALQR
jgi:hypothetical protein